MDKKKIVISVLFSFFISGFFIFILSCFYMNNKTGDISTGKALVAGFIGGFLFSLIILCIEVLYLNMKGELGSSFGGRENISPERKKALYPPIPNYLLSNKPDGLMFGMKGKKYVRLPIQKNNIMHGCIFGAPGTGKSAGPLLSTLIGNFMVEKPPLTIFALDIKPELALKSVNLHDNPHVKVVNPTDFNSCGWDIYYNIRTPNVSHDDVMEVIDSIARSLIVCHDEKKQVFHGRSHQCVQRFDVFCL